MFTPFSFIQPIVFTVPPPGMLVAGYYIAGDFSTYGTNTNPYFRVLDSTGSRATNFNLGSGFNNVVYTAITQSDGKLIVGGIFSTYSGSNPQFIVRLNTNGTRDSSWDINGNANSGVVTLGIDSLGRVIAGGSFTTYAGSSTSRIVRINTDGTRDTTFNIGTGGFNGSLSSLAIQTDNKVIASGAFSIYSGSSTGATRIIRLNTNGTRDTTFNVGNGLNGQANYMVLQSDGKLIAGGQFTSYSGSATGATRIIRLNTNGTRDTTFVATGSGFNSSVRRIFPYTLT